MPDVSVVMTAIDAARSGLANAKNAATQWQSGAVAGVALSAAQTAALSAAITAGLNTGKTGVAAAEAELAS
jgi:hypothetical protein